MRFRTVIEILEAGHVWDPILNVQTKASLDQPLTIEEFNEAATRLRAEGFRDIFNGQTFLWWWEPPEHISKAWFAAGENAYRFDTEVDALLDACHIFWWAREKGMIPG